MGWLMTAAATALLALLAAGMGVLHDQRHGAEVAIAAAIILAIVGVLPMGAIGGRLLLRYWPRGPRIEAT